MRRDSRVIRIVWIKRIALPMWLGGIINSIIIAGLRKALTANSTMFATALAGVLLGPIIQAPGHTAQAAFALAGFPQDQFPGMVFVPMLPTTLAGAMVPLVPGIEARNHAQGTLDQSRFMIRDVDSDQSLTVPDDPLEHR